MSFDSEIWAFVPARGGSRRLPRKNLAVVGGVPLVSSAIAAARGCRLVSRVFVSTEDDEIAAIAESDGGEVLRRPMELAGDEISSEAVLRHALEEAARRHGGYPGHLVLLQPTSPLRTATDLDRCLRGYLESGADSAVSVSPAQSNPHKALRLVGDRLQRLWSPPPGALVCLQNGAIYVVGARRFLETGSLLNDPIFAFPMPAERSIDVDTEIDRLLCEALLQSGKLDVGPAGE